MPGIEVQWIGSSCGRHGSYTFYRGFRLIQDGKASNFCLGEFYFVKNSSTQPTCIAELQLVWYDASTDSKLASARLYFRPEDTPAGRLNYHGEDELLYADQKVVIKCHDIATWVCPGSEWTTGLSLPCESEFVQLNGSPKLSYIGVQRDNKLEENAQLVKSSGATHLHILTFPAYCRYMALRKRMSEGACFTMKQILSLGGMVASNRATKMVFCRESFHDPSLDKFELSIENKAPVLKGRPRKKKRLKIENSANKVIRNRFLTEINGNQCDMESQSPESKVSDDDIGTDSDISEESSQSTEICRQKKVTTVTEKLPASSVNSRSPLNKPQPSGPPPLQPSNKVQIPRLIPMAQVRLNSTTEPAVKAIMNLESKPPPLVKSEAQPKATTTLVTATTNTVGKLDPSSQQPSSSCSSIPASSVSVIPVSKRSLPSNTTVTIATKVSVTAAMSSQKFHNEPVVKQAVQGQGIVESKEVRHPRSNKPRHDTKVFKNEEHGKENVEVEKKTRKRLREPGDFSDIENCEDEDEKYFMKSLRDFMKSRNTPLGKIPALGFKKVNLWTMYNSTQKLGGYEMVTSKRQWRDVYDSLGGSTTITSAATYTRRHYEKLLLPYERYVRGQLSATSKERESESVVSKQSPATQKQKSITQPCLRDATLKQTVPVKKEMDETAVQRESVKVQPRQTEQAKALKANYQPAFSHDSKSVSCSQRVHQHQVELQLRPQPRLQPCSQSILLRAPKPQENTSIVPEVKKIKLERSVKVEQCTGTSIGMGDNVSNKDIIDLTETDGTDSPRDQPRLPHRPCLHSNFPQVPTTVCSHSLRDHPQAERPRARTIIPQVQQQQPVTQAQRNNGKLSAGELTAVAEAHYKSQIATRQESDPGQQQKEVKSVHSSHCVRNQPNHVVKPEKENMKISDQKFAQQEEETSHNENLLGLKRRVSRLSPSEHVKKRRTVNQPSQVSVDDHFEQWRRKTQEAQTKPPTNSASQLHPASKVQPATQVHPANRGVTSSHNTSEVIVVQERAITPQYTRSCYGSERRASVTTDSRIHSNPTVVTDSSKQHSQVHVKEKQNNNSTQTKPVRESHSVSGHGQENTPHVKDSHYIRPEDNSRFHEQRYGRHDTHSHVSLSHHQCTYHASPGRPLVQEKDEMPTPEYYAVRVNSEDLASRPPSLEMDMGDVFPTASSYVGAPFYPAPWAPAAEFLEYPSQGGYQLVAAAAASGDKMGQCSSSRIFMPPSIFPPVAMPPLSPPMLTPGHLVASADGTELRIHPHCMLGSYPAPCTHQMASANTNFPLLQG